MKSQADINTDKKLSCTWNKVKVNIILEKSVLVQLDKNKKEIKKYKEKIGLKIISENKELCIESSYWCEIFNIYIEKLPIFYNYAKSYKTIFSDLNKLISEIKNKSNNIKEEDSFYEKLGNFIFEYTKNSGYMDISN